MLVDSGSLTRNWLCQSGPHSRGLAWGQVGGGRGAQGARARGASAWLREAPHSLLSNGSAQSSPKRSQRHWGLNEVEGRGPGSFPAPSPAGSGLAVALVDVVLHQSHHQLKLVLQLGPPGCGVCLQGRHDLQGKQRGSWAQPWAPVGPPCRSLGRTPRPDFHCW